MKLKKYHLLGVMSGTSRDGIDIAEINLTLANGQWSFRILKTDTVKYTKKWHYKLGKADRFTSGELSLLNKGYTDYLADKILDFIQKNYLKNIDAVCSHGHTVLHQPAQGVTLQIGNLPELAQKIKQTVVCDFRTRDVGLGGQGAPLVPIGDRLLFGDYQACINLGGFANISLERNHKRIAFDVCAVNTVLNFYAEKCGQDYDEGGKIARSGEINSSLLKALNQQDFYKQLPPKSLGIEWVKSEIFPLLEMSNESAQNILATYSLHIAQQLAKAVSTIDNGKILLTGGGVFNHYLIDLLKQRTTNAIVIPDNKLINYKEALIFGLLGVLKMRNEVNVLSSVTGASQDHSSGIIYKP